MEIKVFNINYKLNLVFTLLAGSLFTIGLVGVFFDPAYAYVLFAGAIWGLFCIFYSLNRDTNLLEPINFIFLDVLGGCICRLLYMFFSPNNPNVTEFLLLGRGIHIAIYGGIIIIFGLSIMMCGYVLGMRKTRFAKWKKGFFITSFFKKSKNRLPIAIAILLILSTIGLVIYVKLFGTSFFTTFTKKFIVVTDDEGDASRNGLGIPRFLLLQSTTAYLVFLTWFYVKKKKILSWQGAILIFLFLIGNAPYLFLSSRLPIICNILYWMSLTLIFQEKKAFPWVKVGTIFLILSFVIVIIGVLRQAGKNVNEEDLSISGDSYVDKIFGNRNLLSCDKVGILFEAINNNKYQMEYGQSFVDIFLAPIPKSLWVNKPETAIEVRTEFLYIGPLGSSGTVPPSLIGEGYLEFGFFGIIVLLFAYGYFMAYMYNVFNNSVKSASFVLYFFFCYNFGFNLIGFSVAMVIVQYLTAVIPVYFILRWLK